jgi:hypothetical protein
MRQLEGSRVDPLRTTGKWGNMDSHGSYAAADSSSGGRAYNQRDGWRSSALPPRSRWRQYEMNSRSRTPVNAT